MLAEVQPQPTTAKPADEPLTPEEAAQMRVHLRFLKEYRKELRLRLNATEDLLLNGVREPTHRGVCQHLLSKIDRSRVLAAVQRLDPMAATGLVEGVLRISPDIEYVLLYLECVQRSTSPKVATAALARGLERIDFAQVSHAQMRRVLDLIVELFDEQQLPELLLGLLEGRSFREAFDASAASLPDPLATLVVPLRAVQAAVLHGRTRPPEPEVLRRGVELLLGATDKTLLHYSHAVQRRLLELGARGGEPVPAAAQHGLALLHGALPGSDPEHLDLGLCVVRCLLASGAEADARRILRGLAREHSRAEQPPRWLEALDAPRLGAVALLAPARSGEGDGARPRRKRAGLWLPSMRPVWVFVGSGSADEGHAPAEQLLRGLGLPGVAVWLGSGHTDDGAPYWVVPHPGQSLEHALDRKGGLGLRAALRACGDALGVLGALAAAGVSMPDARPRRFELSPEGRLWLVDLTGAEQQPPSRVLRHHAEIGRALCRSVLQRARRYLPPPDLFEAVERGAEPDELLQRIERRLEG